MNRRALLSGAAATVAAAPFALPLSPAPFELLLDMTPRAIENVRPPLRVMADYTAYGTDDQDLYLTDRMAKYTAHLTDQGITDRIDSLWKFKCA